MEQNNIQTCMATIDGLREGKYYVEKGYSYYDDDEVFYDPYGVCERISACIEVMKEFAKEGNYQQVYHIGFQLVYNGIRIVWENGEELEWNALWEVDVLDGIDELETLLYEAIYQYPLEYCLALILKVEPFLNNSFCHLLKVDEKKYRLLLMAYCRYYCLYRSTTYASFSCVCHKLSFEELYSLAIEFDDFNLYQALLSKKDDPLFLRMIYPLLDDLENGYTRSQLAYNCYLLSDDLKVKQNSLLIAFHDDFCLKYYLLLKYELKVEGHLLDEIISKVKVDEYKVVYYEICMVNNLICESVDEFLLSKYQCMFDKDCVTLIGFLLYLLYDGDNNKISNSLSYGNEKSKTYLEIVKKEIKLSQEDKVKLLMRLKDSLDVYILYACNNALRDLYYSIACYVCALSYLLYEAKLNDNYVKEVMDKYYHYRKLRSLIRHYLS